MIYLGYEQVVCSSGTVQTVSALTVPAKATHAELQADTGGLVRLTLDGSTDPTTTSGIILPTTGGETKVVAIDTLKNIRFIKGADNTHLNVSYLAGRDI